jgi:hypothetical protein
MVNVIVILEIDPQKIDEFLAVILENAAASRQEPGCLRFEVSRDATPSRISLPSAKAIATWPPWRLITPLPTSRNGVRNHRASCSSAGP